MDGGADDIRFVVTFLRDQTGVLKSVDFADADLCLL